MSGSVPKHVEAQRPASRKRRRLQARVAVTLSVAMLVTVLVIEGFSGAGAEVTGLPAGFTDSVVFSGLNNPTVIQFGPDGRVWVGEKSGIVKVFDSLADTTPTVFADLRTETHNWWDRGLLGLTLDPNFDNGRPYVYVQYTYDKQPGNATVPRWGNANQTDDTCNGDPEGGTKWGCVVMGRVSRLTVAGNGSASTMVPGSENVLVEDWCAQFPSHSIGTITFGPDGYLYAAGGDGASFTLVDRGQFGGGNGVPVNPCQDQGGGTANGEGGALRAQSVRTAATANGPTSLDGAVIRINPDTGAAAPGNPLAARANTNERRVIAAGLRNPFRLTFRPNLDGSLSNELWLGDVGWNNFEEINRFTVGDGSLPNFGWPCYEGGDVNWGYSNANLGLCQSLYAQGDSAVRQPFMFYGHHNDVVNGDSCTVGDGGSSITGVAFYTATSYPADYRGGLFFTDYNRKCIWVSKVGSNGLPSASRISLFAHLGQHDSGDSESDGGAVDIVTGPGGDLFWVDLFGGTIHRISYAASANQAPTARFTASPTSGVAPLAVSFDGSTSTDPEGTTLSYAWNFGDGTTASGPKPTHTFTGTGNRTVTLTVTDGGVPPKSASKTTTISVNNTAPTPVIDSPNPGLTWKVGDTIDFSGHATDPQGDDVTLSWKVRLLTCISDSDCVPRQVTPYTGDSGSYSAPDWGGAGRNVVELALTATDSAGLASTVTRRLEPIMATLRVTSSPSGLRLSVDSAPVTTPFQRDYILGSTHSLGALTQDGATFLSWSDGGAAAHEVSLTAATTTLTANFSTPPTPPTPTTTTPPPPPAPTGFAALPHATQVAIIQFIAAVRWAQFVAFCKAVIRFQAAARKKAARHSTRRR